MKKQKQLYATTKTTATLACLLQKLMMHYCCSRGRSRSCVSACNFPLLLFSRANCVQLSISLTCRAAPSCYCNQICCVSHHGGVSHVSHTWRFAYAITQNRNVDFSGLCSSNLTSMRVYCPRCMGSATQLPTTCPTLGTDTFPFAQVCVCERVWCVYLGPCSSTPPRKRAQKATAALMNATVNRVPRSRCRQQQQQQQQQKPPQAAATAAAATHMHEDHYQHSTRRRGR